MVAADPGQRASRSRRHRLRAVVPIALAALAISACTSNGAATPSTSASSPATAGTSLPTTGSTASASAQSTGASGSAGATASYTPADCPNPIYPAVPALDLGPDFECGYLTVPQNRQEPDGTTIQLAVARIKATSPTPAPDPIVYLTGGPGGSALLGAVQRVEAGWNADREVIFFDQRGTWKSDPLLACPEVDAFMAEWVGLNTADPATAEKSGQAVRACRDRVVAEGWDPADYNTTENAADIADLRTALGIEEWNLYGVSYGTDLALQTLRDHPEGIRSVVLDSVVPPQQVIFDGFWPSAAHGFQILFDDCAADTACSAAFPNVHTDFTAQVNALTEQPRTVSVPDPVTGQNVDVLIDGYKLANLVLTASLVPGSIAPLPAMIDNLANGDGTQAAAALLAGRPPSGVTAYGLAFGVFCSEHAAFGSPEEMLAAGRAVLPDFPDAVLSLSPQAPWIFSDCAQWDVPAADRAVQTPVASDVPALLISGNLDAVTAPPNADAVAPGLTNSTSLVFPDAAHDVMIWSPECAVSVMHNFLNQPDSFDDSCVATLAPPTFTTS